MNLHNESRTALREVNDTDDAYGMVPVDDIDIDMPEIKPLVNWSACGRGLACTCGAAGVSHIGCVVGPTLAFMGAAGSASIATVSAGMSLALTAAGAGLWYALRGRKPETGKWEKRLTPIGMAAGAALTLGLHFSGAMAGHDHDHIHNMEEALQWYRDRPAQTQLEIRESAATLGVPLQDYIFEICGSEPVGAATGKKSAGPGLDKL